MIAKYQPQEFEGKWREKWKEEGLYGTPLRSLNQRATLGAGKKKFYTLVELPYTSGDLHVGHWFSFTIPDILSRFKRMNGFNVFYPIGYDAFGLPAENAAIKHKIHPKDWTLKNVENMTKQFQTMGTMLNNWDDVVITCLPEYYRWNQWIFLKFWEKGLAYRGKALSNWCPSCQTVLANENIENGKCWRCGNPVIQKQVEQWFLKITDYADRLLWNNHSNGVDWPVSVRVGQNNWIGKKEGVLIKHKVRDLDLVFESFSAFPAWLWADTFIVIAPEHPLVERLVQGTKYEKESEIFVKRMKGKTQEERLKEIDTKEGVFTGRYAKDPFAYAQGKPADMPIWISNFALMDFGSGIIRCSAHDPRDYAFAQKYKIELKEVVERSDKKTPVNAHDNKGILKNSGLFTGKKIEESLAEIVGWIVKQKIGKKHFNYHLRDWSVSRQRYWGTPVPMINCSNCGTVPVPEKDLPVGLPYEVDFTPKGKPFGSAQGKPPLASNEKWLNVKCPKCGKNAKRDAETLDTFFDSAWYWFRYVSPHYDKAPFDKKMVKDLTPVDVYFGGSEHTLGHTMYARFFTKFFHDLGLVDYEEFALKRIQHGVVLGPDGNRMSKSKGNVINPDEVVKEYGTDTVRMYLCFMMPYEATGPWSDKTIAGVHRFLNRVWKIYQNFQFSILNFQSNPNSQNPNDKSNPKSKIQNQDKTLVAKLNKTIQKVTSDIEKIKMNTAIAAMMEMINDWETVVNSQFLISKFQSNPKSQIQNKKNNETMKQLNNSLSVENAKKFLQILAPFAPHMTEEIWRNVFGEKESIHLSSWPKAMETVAETITIPVQVNGKVRDLLIVNSELLIDEKKVTDLALKSEKVKKYLAKKKYRAIYVQGKILNLVVQ